MFIPYNVDVPMRRWPWANWGLIAATCLISLMIILNYREDMPVPLALHRGEWFNPLGLFTHVFVHGGLDHLLGNMLFLFVFGNAVNAKVGHWQYLTLYMAAGIVAGLSWVIFGSSELTYLGSADIPAVGASGAIMGIVGMFLILYPLNDVCFFYVFILQFGTVRISARWVIALYLIFDIWGLLQADNNIAYQAHVGGALFGLGIMAALVYWDWVTSEKSERNLLQLLNYKPLHQTLTVLHPAPHASPVVPTGPVIHTFTVHAKDRTTGYATTFHLQARSIADAHTKAAQTAQQDDLRITNVEQTA
ncbi:MAG: rhomboid family intramembrane serine protease [Phycisphaerae bacterium]